MAACPTEFQSTTTGLCEYTCPVGKGFRNSGGKCVYNNSEHSVELTPVPALTGLSGATSYQTLTNNSLFANEATRVNAQIEILLSRLGQSQVVRDAFLDLQEKEAIRASHPQEYQQARNRYYELTGEDGWIDDEKIIVENNQVKPVIETYNKKYTDLLNYSQNQKNTIDTINAIKNKVLTIKDDMIYSVSAFGRQLEDVQSQIRINERLGTRTITNPADVATFQWVDMLMNGLLGLCIIIVMYFGLRKYFFTGSIQQNGQQIGYT